MLQVSSKTKTTDMVTLHRLALMACLTTWLTTTRVVTLKFGVVIAEPVIVFAALLGAVTISQPIGLVRELPIVLVALLTAALPIVGGIMTASLIVAQGTERLAAAAYLILRLADHSSSWKVGPLGRALR